MKYVIICLIFLSCKTDTKENRSIIDQNIFKIHIDTIVLKDDIFGVFYLHEDLSEIVKFNEKNKVRKKVVGSEKIQKVTFDLPKDARKYQFRIDLGNNKNRQKIVIKSITLSFGNHNILITNDLIKSFFILDRYVDFNEINGTVELKNIEQKKVPFITAKPILIKRIALEL